MTVVWSWHTESKSEHERLVKTLVFTGVTTSYSLFLYTAVGRARGRTTMGITHRDNK